jgi:hypothetical protein
MRNLQRAAELDPRNFDIPQTAAAFSLSPPTISV